MNSKRDKVSECINHSLIIRQPNGNPNRLQSVYLLFRIQGKQFKIKTGAKVTPKKWNGGRYYQDSLTNVKIHDKNLIILNKNNLQFEKLNSYLCTHEKEEHKTNIETIVSMFFLNYKSRGMIEKKKNNEQQQLTTILKELANLKEKKRDIKAATKHSYINVINAYMRYLACNNISDTIDNAATKETLEQYQHYLLLKGNAANGINQIINTLVRLLELMAEQAKYNYSFDASMPKYLKLKEKKHKQALKESYFTLTDDEIQRIYHYQDNNLKPLTPKQEFTKDLFVFECLTGQRISDCINLLTGLTDAKPYASANGKHYLSYHCKKTGTECLIALDEDNEVKEIIDKYAAKKEIRTKLMTDKDQINDHIKLICKRLNINRTVKRLKGNSLKEVPLYEAIHTHVGRHTFVTRMYKKGFSKDDIIMYTGHQDTKLIDCIYLNLTQQDKVNHLDNRVVRNATSLNDVSATLPPNSDTYNLLLLLIKENQELKAALNNNNGQQPITQNSQPNI